MKKFFLSAAAFAVVAVSAIAVAPNSAEAVPTFARQTGAACLSCHFNTIPRLGPMGRNFRMGSFRDMGDAALLEDDILSLPVQFGASMLWKARISSGQTKDGTGTVTNAGGVVATPAGGSTAAIQWPDETALFFGGRMGEHMGTFVEWGFAPDASTQGDSGVSPLGFKVAYVFDLDSGLIAIAGGTSDALGAPSVFNDPSNAISRNTRGIQTRARALRATPLHAGATGVGVYGYLNDLVYFAVGGIVDAGGGTTLNGGVDMNLSPYLRLAATLDLGGFDTVVGGWYTDLSTANYSQAGGTKNSGTIYGADIQLQGEVGDLMVGFYMPVVLKAESRAALAAQTNTTGFNPYVNIGIGHAGLRIGYDYSKIKNVQAGTVASKRNNYIIGGWYSLAQNIELDLEFNADKTKNAAGNITSKLNSTTLMLEYVF